MEKQALRVHKRKWFRYVGNFMNRNPYLDGIHFIHENPYARSSEDEIHFMKHVATSESWIICEGNQSQKKIRQYMGLLEEGMNIILLLLRRALLSVFFFFCREASISIFSLMLCHPFEQQRHSQREKEEEKERGSSTDTACEHQQCRWCRIPAGRITFVNLALYQPWMGIPNKACPDPSLEVYSVT